MVQHSGDADLCAKVLWIGSNGQCSLGACLEQNVVHDALVLKSEISNRSRQREDDVKVPDREQLGFACFEPIACRCCLTLGAVTVAATVVGNVDMTAGIALAACNVAAERCCSTAFDRRHHLHLVETDVTTTGITPCGPVIMKDIRDLQCRTQHCWRSYVLVFLLRRFLDGTLSRSMGLSSLEIRPVATRA